MMGQLTCGQNALFYDFTLEKHIPPDHLLRQIERFLDFGPLRQHLSPYYSATGRPSIDPELMLRMLIVGYCYGIRAERRLCEEVHFNLAYRWFCRLGLEGNVPEHSTFSKNRHGRFRESNLFRTLFEQVVRACMHEGLVGGEGFAIDASTVRADANRQRGVAGTEAIDWTDSARATRPVREYLAALDAQTEPQAVAKNISLTDPLARWTAAPGGPAFYAYATNYLVDIAQGVIIDVEATPAHRTCEVDATKTMVDRVRATFDLAPQRLVGDMAYGAAPMLGWLVQDKAIEPHSPVWDKAQRNDGTFSRSDFHFDPQRNEYRCPANKSLRTTAEVTVDRTVLYRASTYDCQDCPLEPKCCPNTPQRKVPRSVHESSRDLARAIAEPPEYAQSRRDRKKVEMRFAHLKRILKLDRLRLRGLTGAHDEFLWAAIVQNLRALAMRCTEGGWHGAPTTT